MSQITKSVSVQTKTAIGNELRDYIISLLEARGNRVDREFRLGTKKIDILFVQEDELTPRIIAIEVKNYDKNLGQDELTHIYASHLSLLQTRQIDELWTLVRLDYSPEAKNWASHQLGLRLFTLPEFEERQFGFRRYARQLAKLFNEQNLNDYYVQQRTANDVYMRDYIMNWISADDARPVAIIAGYGMGKTSFCKYITNQLCEEYLADPLKRVPVYIRLAEIAHEQDLDGLLGKILGSRFRLNNYHFEDVMALNRSGKFVFIFDGFDEMKHALTWDMFKFNFSQINRTVTSRSKVIITGRPNAFLSDNEHNWALRGTRISNSHNILLSDWPSYQEVSIEPFTDSEIEIFLRKYLDTKIKSAGRMPQSKDVAWIESRVDDFKRLALKDVLHRPVHLKIFADIAAKRDLTLNAQNIFELYEIGADLTFEQEMGKSERIKISGMTRRELLQDVAWWLWKKDGGRSLNFHPREIPWSVLSKLPPADDDEREGLLREIFSGVFIERKFGENFFFAHRSFLEFFVAKVLLDRSRSEALSIGAINAAINPDIIEFLRSSGKDDAFFSYVFEGIQIYSGELKLDLLRELQRFVRDEQKRLKGRKELQHHIAVLIKAVSLYEAFELEEIRSDLADIVHNDLMLGSDERQKDALYFVLDALINSLNSEKVSKYIDDICRFLVSQVDFRRLRGNVRSSENIFERLFFKCTYIDKRLEPVVVGGREIQKKVVERLKVDLAKMLAEMTLTAAPRITIATEEVAGPRAHVHIMEVDELGITLESDRNRLLEALGQGGAERSDLSN